MIGDRWQFIETGIVGIVTNETKTKTTLKGYGWNFEVNTKRLATIARQLDYEDTTTKCALYPEHTPQPKENVNDRL